MSQSQWNSGWVQNDQWRDNTARASREAAEPRGDRNWTPQESWGGPPEDDRPHSSGSSEVEVALPQSVEQNAEQMRIDNERERINLGLQRGHVSRRPERVMSRMDREFLAELRQNLEDRFIHTGTIFKVGVCRTCSARKLINYTFSNINNPERHRGPPNEDDIVLRYHCVNCANTRFSTRRVGSRPGVNPPYVNVDYLQALHLLRDAFVHDRADRITLPVARAFVVELAGFNSRLNWRLSLSEFTILVNWAGGEYRQDASGSDWEQYEGDLNMYSARYALEHREGRMVRNAPNRLGSAPGIIRVAPRLDRESRSEDRGTPVNRPRNSTVEQMQGLGRRRQRNAAAAEAISTEQANALRRVREALGRNTPAWARNVIQDFENPQPEYTPFSGQGRRLGEDAPNSAGTGETGDKGSGKSQSTISPRLRICRWDSFW